MGVIEHPVKGQSLLPPRTLHKINTMNSSMRKVYLQELIGSYESKILTLDKVAEKMRVKWAKYQALQLNRVLRELRDIMELEKSTRG